MMEYRIRFTFLAIVASGIIALSSCNNAQNDNQNYQDSLDNEEEMMAPPMDTTMNDTINNMGDTTTTP